jgi:hypothetical protein
VSTGVSRQLLVDPSSAARNSHSGEDRTVSGGRQIASGSSQAYADAREHFPFHLRQDERGGRIDRQRFVPAEADDTGDELKSTLQRLVEIGMVRIVSGLREAAEFSRGSDRGEEGIDQQSDQLPGDKVFVRNQSVGKEIRAADWEEVRQLGCCVSEHCEVIVPRDEGDP